MSLRLRLFLLLSAVVAGLILAQWWLVRVLTRDLSSNVGQVAMAVSESLVTQLAKEPLGGPGGQSIPRGQAAPPDGSFEKPARAVTEHLVHVREVNGRLQVVGERFVSGPEGATFAPTPSVPSTPSSMPGEEAQRKQLGGPEGSDAFVLRMESPVNARYVELSSEGMKERIPIPRGAVSDTLERFKRHSLAGSAILLCVGLLAAAVVAHRATAPLRDLAGAARMVGDGELGAQVGVRAGGGAEMREAMTAFNKMSARLAELDEQARILREREHLSELGEVARGLAHGLRNPLNALGLSLEELASDEGVEPGRREALAMSARRQIRRIDGAVRSFLTLATSGAAAPAERVDVLALVQDVALEASADARGRVSVAVEAQSRPAPIVGVAAEIRAVVQALVVNAVEASPDGGRVVIRVAPIGTGGARVEIDDDGSGLSPAVREKLFTPHLTTKPSGAGMGLYLAQRIVTTRHGGRLRLDDREPRGTRAVLELDATRLEGAGREW